MSFCVRVTAPDGAVMHVRSGLRPGEGPVVRFPSEAAARKTIDFFKVGMTKGVDYDAFEIIDHTDDLPEYDEA